MDRQAEDARARRRFMIINLMRIGGVAMILFAIAILYDAVELPDPVAWVLLALGFFETFITPQILARMWRTPVDAALSGERSDRDK